jgi:hypothetical protein
MQNQVGTVAECSSNNPAISPPAAVIKRARLASTHIPYLSCGSCPHWHHGRRRRRRMMRTILGNVGEKQAFHRGG